MSKPNLNELLQIGIAIWAMFFVAYLISVSVYFWLDIDKPETEKRNPAWLMVLALAAYSPILVPILAIGGIIELMGRFFKHR